MESKIFTRRISHRQIYQVGNMTEAIAEEWSRMNFSAAEYIAEHLTDDRYQLLRCLREVNELPHELPHERCVELRLIVEAGQVTTRSRVDMIAPPSREAVQLANRTWGEMTGEDFDDFDQTDNWSLPHPLKPSLEPAPLSGRKVLVDKHPQPA